MLTFKRFEQGPNGIETNRDELAKMAEKYFYQSPVFGVGAKRIEDIEYMGDNPYELLAKDGILGYVITYFPLFFCGINYRKYPNVFWSVIILFIGYQQRPFHINLVHYVTFFTFIYACMKYKNNKLIYGR